MHQKSEKPVYSVHSKSFQSFHCKLICASWPQDSFAKSRPRVGQSNPHEIRMMDLTSLTKKGGSSTYHRSHQKLQTWAYLFLNILKTSSLENNASYISFWNGPLIWKGHVNFREAHWSFREVPLKKACDPNALRGCFWDDSGGYQAHGLCWEPTNPWVIIGERRCFTMFKWDKRIKVHLPGLVGGFNPSEKY